MCEQQCVQCTWDGVKLVKMCKHHEEIDTLTARLAEAQEYNARLRESLKVERDAMKRLNKRLTEAERLLGSRAGKLLKKGKTFIVVAIDEPYFSFVYDLIRKQEKHKGRWTDACEAAFQAANKEVNEIYAAKGGRDEY